MPKIIALSALLLLVLPTGCAETPTEDAVDTGPLAVDQCLSPDDVEIILASRGELDGGVAPEHEVGDYFRECALGPCLETILADGDAETCIDLCIDGTEVAPLSHACRGCYIEGFFCAQDNCVLQCLGSDPQACDTCIESNCDPRFYGCAGI